MLRLCTPVIVLLVSLTVFSLGKDVDKRAEIERIYDQSYRDLRLQHFDSLKEFFTSDFTMKLADGIVLTRDQQIERLQQVIKSVKTLDSVKYEIERSQVRGNDVLLTVRTRMFFTVGNWREPQKNDEQFTDDLTEDTWTKTAQGWKLKTSLQLRGTISAQGTPAEPNIESPKLAALAKKWKSGDHVAVNAFWREMAGKTPLIEEAKNNDKKLLVTFLWRGKDQVSMYGGLPPSDPKPLTRLYDSDVWYRTEEIPRDARSTYAFQVEGTITHPKKLHFTEVVPDPLNPRAYSYGSVFELPNAPAQPYLGERKGTPKGTLSKLKIKSVILNEERDYGVYTPPGFDVRSAVPYKLLVLFDGEVYGNGPDPLVPAPTIVDNLLAEKKLPPTVTLLVNYSSDQLRIRDLACSEQFENFLATELVPAVQKQFNVSSNPGDIVVGGSSLGGLAASCSGLMHPEVFGNILSQSGSYWYVRNWLKEVAFPYYTQTGWAIEEFAKRPKLPLRFYIEIGRFDSPSHMLATNRHLRDVLRLKGYPVVYSEFDGGHDYLCWRGSLAEGLVALLGVDNFPAERSAK